jgi:hypothetical protein
MTAIAAVCAKSGFVIAADGNLACEDTDASDAARQEERADAQKIFEISGGGRSMAYAFLGTVLNRTIGYDLANECTRQVLTLSCESFQSGAAGVGRLVVEDKPDPATGEHMARAMAGAAFDALLRPKAPLLSVFPRSCRCGFRKAPWQPASTCFSDTGWKDRKRVMPAFLRSKGLVRANPGTIVRLGRVLAVRGRMVCDEILEAATDPEAACPPSRRPQAGTGTSAGKGKKPNPLEEVARMGRPVGTRTPDLSGQPGRSNQSRPPR